MEANVIVLELFGELGKLLLWGVFTALAYTYNTADTLSLIFIFTIPFVALSSLMIIDPAKK